MPRITCPYCWQPIDIEDTLPQHEPVEFVTDCEICCRPIRVIATWEDGDDEPILDTAPELD